MLRWCLSLGLCLAAVLAILGSTWLGGSVASLEEKRTNLQNKANELMRLKKDQEAIAAKADAWRELMASADQASLTPDRWFTNPLDGSGEMEWARLESLVRLISSAHPLSTGYWYRPESFQIRRMEPEPAGDPEAGDVVPVSNRYTVQVRGAFFIPR